MGYEVRVPYSAFSTIQQTLVQRERREDAAAVMMSAIDTYPENANAHFVLATIHAQTNDKEKAIEQLKAALQINPNYVPAQRMLENYD
jgi:lipopolysaccharide biosynthesis regulator YciM